MPVTNNNASQIWLDGAFVPYNDAQFHFLSHSLHYGGVIFDGVRAYGGCIFKLQEHTARLFDGARILGIDLSFSEDAVNAACIEILEKSGLSDAYLRPAILRGAGQMGISPLGVSTHVCIAVFEWPSYFDQAKRMAGIKLTTSNWRRPAPDTAPTQAKASGLYQICAMAKAAAESQGFDDALMLDYRGYIAEATGANIFLRMGDELHTPIPDCFLDGITRQTVIEIARAKGIKVVERHIKPDELSNVIEIFLTGTAAEVVPVQSIDEKKFSPGAMCELMITRYSELTNEQAR